MSRIRKVKPGSEIQKSQPQKKKVNRAAIFTVILAGLMIFSVFGIMMYGYTNAETGFTYNKFQFKRSTDGWTTKIDGKTVEFLYPPDSVEKITVDPKITEKILASRMIYLTVDPEAKDIGSFEATRLDFALKFPEYFSIYVANGVTKENELYSKQPIITCANATTTVPVIYFKDGNTTGFELKQNCIIFSSEQQAGLALRDRIMYSLFKIMP
jgi:hypothetical protein